MNMKRISLSAMLLALWCLIGFVFYLVTVVRRRAARPVEAES